jgi:hypothetical protein
VRRDQQLGLGVIFVLALSCSGGSAGGSSAPSTSVTAKNESFAGYAADAARVLENALFTQGNWRLCLSGCGAVNSDWGADSLTYTAYLGWRTIQDPRLAGLFPELVTTAHVWGPCTSQPANCPWSDVPEWDAIADLREYTVTGNAIALQNAEAAYRYVAQSPNFALGACPQIHYQHPLGGGGGLKTLETDANAIKAALLLYAATTNASYLSDAQRLYSAVRHYFLDPTLPLYTVYVFDNGRSCSQVQRQFFGSVNGDMIFNGLDLFRITGNQSYLNDARATTHAVAKQLADGRGIYAQLQAENDIGEPLVEAMYEMAQQGDAEARTWILANANAALLQDRAASGLYGRFFDGPTPTWNVTAWQSSGGLALAIVAAVLRPTQTAEAAAWSSAAFVSRSIATLPSPVITFHGSAIAVIGAIGDRCCEPGHAQVLLDGTQTIDQTGIWQNKSSSGLRIPNAVLFAWRWNSPGNHTIQFLPGPANAKEGGPYLNATGYYVLP